MSHSTQIIKRLSALHPDVIDLHLDRMTRLLNSLGEPQNNIPPVIHVAGTNGKGSTIAYLHAMFQASNLKSHCYTSPHLVEFHERIRLAVEGGSRFISDDELLEFLDICEEANAGAEITYFEFTTAIAFLAFQKFPADYSLLEVGLGGRLDATNVITQPALTIITSISHDHQKFLGESLQEIAHEKAGILKPNIPCVTGHMPLEAYQVIEKRADALGVPLFSEGVHWQVRKENGRLVFQDLDGLLDLNLPVLRGTHQILNAGTAIAAIRCLRQEKIQLEQIETGLKTAQWPARLHLLPEGRLHEVLPAQTEIWLDGGHNPAAGLSLAHSMADIGEKSPRDLIVICGMMENKDARLFLEPFQGLVKEIFTLNIPGKENSYSEHDLAALAQEAGLKATPAASLEAALGSISKTYAHAPRILICGSLYLAGEILKNLP